MRVDPTIKASLCVCVCAGMHARHKLCCQTQFVWMAERWQQLELYVCECVSLWGYKQQTVVYMLHYSFHMLT